MTNLSNQRFWNATYFNTKYRLRQLYFWSIFSLPERNIFKCDLSFKCPFLESHPSQMWHISIRCVLERRCFVNILSFQFSATMKGWQLWRSNIFGHWINMTCLCSAHQVEGFNDVIIKWLVNDLCHSAVTHCINISWAIQVNLAFCTLHANVMPRV